MFYGLFFYLSHILGLASGAFRKLPNQRKFKETIALLEQRHKSHQRMVAYTAVVSYQVKGKTYHVKSSYQPSFFKPGKKLVVPMMLKTRKIALLE